MRICLDGLNDLYELFNILKIKSLISVTSVLVLALMLSVFFFSDCANASYEKEKQNLNKKIFELKKKEKLELKNLTKKQQNLEDTKQTIKDCQGKLEQSRNNLEEIQTQLYRLAGEQNNAARHAGKRIKEIYKGERINNLYFIFAANDLNTFLDRMYFQKILSKKDDQALEDLRRRARHINYSRLSVENEKNNIAMTLNVMNQKKQQLNSSIQTSQSLINRLRTDRATYEKAQQELEYLSHRIESQIRHSKNSKMLANTNFIRPLSGIITSPFGWRRHPIFGSRRFHTGVDISSSYGTPIKSSNEGRVIYTGWYGGYGKVVIVDHGKIETGSRKGQGISTLYAHLSSISAGNGSIVKKGQVIGYEGTTGYSTGPHLHFEVRIEGKPHDPLSFVRL